MSVVAVNVICVLSVFVLVEYFEFRSTQTTRTNFHGN